MRLSLFCSDINTGISQKTLCKLNFTSHLYNFFTFIRQLSHNRDAAYFFDRFYIMQQVQN